LFSRTEGKCRVGGTMPDERQQNQQRSG